jgi:hypothetical protein
MKAFTELLNKAVLTVLKVSNKKKLWTNKMTDYWNTAENLIEKLLILRTEIRQHSNIYLVFSTFWITINFLDFYKVSIL